MAPSHIRRFKLSALSVLSVLALPVFAACSDANPTIATSTGGAQGSGGSVSTTTGGMVASAGVPSASGGAVSSGGVTGGGAPVGQGGGTGTSGGSTSSGGATSAGAGAGGNSSSGGTGSGGVGSGGASKGGSTSSGGAANGGNGGAGSCTLASLATYRPKSDAELAEMFDDYLNTEVGAVTCATSAPAGTSRTITQTILVPANVTYDGKGETLEADATAMKCDLTAGEQGESQRPYFLLAPGASVKNVTVAYPGCDGIHMMGDNVLDNVAWPDAGEDAASVRSYFPGGKITIRNSNGHKAADKMFQFNAACDVRIENFTGSEMGKLVRQNGDTTFELHVDLNTVNVTGVISAVVQSDSLLCYVRHHALTYQFTGSGDKSDRVFRDVPPANVTAY